MKDIKITDVRHIKGDSAFLIDDGETAVLYDSGFGFTGYSIADNIKSELGERKLDYIFLTHSHYDHALGAAYILNRYPDAKVVAGEYAVGIFAKPTAKSVMRDLDKKFAEKCGVAEYDDLADNLKVDISVKEGDIINAGKMQFRVINLPGHTKCSVGYYMEENCLLLGCETIGVFDGVNTVIPSYLVGYKMALESIAKAKALKIDRILVPHCGALNDEQTKIYLENAEKSAVETAGEIADILKSGGSQEDAVRHFKNKFYHDRIKEIYPEDAINLNTEIMVRLIERELVNN